MRPIVSVVSEKGRTVHRPVSVGEGPFPSQSGDSIPVEAVKGDVPPPRPVVSEKERTLPQPVSVWRGLLLRSLGLRPLW